MKLRPTIAFTCLLCSSVTASELIDIGSRLEPMIDNHLIATMSDGLHFQLHKPVRRKVA